ncbi:MAG: phosphotransferase, partial [Pseudomonadota bacterium]|nr:phosphotransferase [Pseudomonadota bacterium]
MSALLMLPVEQQLQIMEQVATDALIHWGIQSAALELIKHRENAVYKIASGSKTYALRVHRQGYHSDRTLDSELLWMNALNQSGVETPIVIPTENGALFKRIFHPQISEPFQVDLQEWFDGTPLGEISAGQDIADIATHYKQIGIIAAKTHNQACNWEAPAH